MAYKVFEPTRWCINFLKIHKQRKRERVKERNREREKKRKRNREREKVRRRERVKKKGEE